MKPVAYHRLAARELVKSAEFYERRRPLLGDRFLDAIETAQAYVQRRPELGRKESRGALSRKVKHFPFRLVYYVQPDRLWIVAVAHLSRRPGYWWRRLD